MNDYKKRLIIYLNKIYTNIFFYLSPTYVSRKLEYKHNYAIILYKISFFIIYITSNETTKEVNKFIF